MITAVETWLQRCRRTIGSWNARPGFRRIGQGLIWGAAGFLLSAASLGNTFQSLAMGLVCALPGWESLAAALGSAVGYRVFWGAAGVQGTVWAAVGLALRLTLGRLRGRESGLLLPVAAAFGVSAAGLAFQIFQGDETGVGTYLVRVMLAAGSTALFTRVREKPDSPLRYGAQGVGVLALAQIVPVPWLGLGWIAGGWLGAAGEFPAVVLAGMGLDLAGVTRVPMTVALSLGFALGRLPLGTRWHRFAAPLAAYCLVMGICGVWDAAPLAGLALGGVLAAMAPAGRPSGRARGQTGIAQVRLELMAGVLQQYRRLLLEIRRDPPDLEALACRVRERACGGCPHRKQCRDIRVPGELLSETLTEPPALPFPCRKPGRMAMELRRGQEQLRQLRADRARQGEYREAVLQQYGFLGEFLREQSDLLARSGGPKQRFRAEVAIRSVGKEPANGDFCQEFAGTECRHYVLLCDGMGTGLGAAQEGMAAGELLRQMLSAGFPAEHAIRSLNSLLALGNRGGASTVDLAEIRLDTGRISLYKWGAAPSYLLRAGGAEKIGTAGPPPGLFVTQTRETTERLSLREGEALILFSDGVDAPGALRREGISPESPSGELAAKLLERWEERGDDATAAVIRLLPGATSLS